jgi:hypothetical protein
MKVYFFPPRLYQVTHMSTSNFWPLDFDTDGEIYENVAWDLPGFRRPRTKAKPAARAKRETGRKERDR